MFATCGRTNITYIDDGRIKNTEKNDDWGIAVRVLNGRKIGQASATCSSEQDAERCARAAMRLAGLAPATGTFDRLPSPAPSSLSPNNWDPLVAEADGGKLGEIVQAVVDEAGSRKVRTPKGMLRCGSMETLLRNSNGIDASNRYTLVHSDLTSMTNGLSPGEGFETYTSPWLEGFDPVCAGASLAERAQAAVRAKSLSGPLDLPLFIAPGELGPMLDSQVGMAAAADSVHNRRSPWRGKLGQSVASPELTIIDDPGDPRAVLSAPYDDEGVPTSVKPVVECGVLRTHLYDACASSVDGRAPSGNGVRRRPNDSQFLFRTAPAPRHFNLVVRPGSQGREEMLASFDRCVLIEKLSFPDVNPITGTFALEVRLGHVLNRGTVESTFKHALVVGNLVEALKNIVAIGRDVEVVNSMILPTIGFNGIDVVGSG